MTKPDFWYTINLSKTSVSFRFFCNKEVIGAVKQTELIMSDKQSRVMNWWREGSRDAGYEAIICDGAIRSGKTLCMFLSFSEWAMSEFCDTDFVIAGKSIGSVTRNVITPMLRFLEKRGCEVVQRRSENLIKVAKDGAENRFYLFGGLNEGSYALIQGMTLGGVLLDEVALMPRSFAEQACARCSLPGSRLWFNCNPEGPEHWFLKEWILPAEEKNALHLHFTMEDNPSLSEQVRERYRRQYSGSFYDRYILGLWTGAEGLIYPGLAGSISKKDGKFLLPAAEARAMARGDADERGIIAEINVGVDFGGSRSGHAFVATGITRGWGKLIVLRSVRYAEGEPDPATGRMMSDIDPVALGELFIDFYRGIIGDYGFVTRVYADSAEQVLIRCLRNALLKAGFPGAKVENARKSPVIGRIRAVSTLASQGRLFFTEECAAFERAVSAARWNPKAVKLERLDDGSTDIDTLDAFEYSFERRINKMCSVQREMCNDETIKQQKSDN